MQITSSYPLPSVKPREESGGIVNRKSFRVYKVKLNTALFGFLFGVYRFGACKARIVDIGNYKKGRTSVAVKRIIDSTETPSVRWEASIAIRPPSTIPILCSSGSDRGMIHRVECADNAAHRLGKASVKVCIGIIGKETVCKKSLDRYIAVLRIAAAEGVLDLRAPSDCPCKNARAELQIRRRARTCSSNSRPLP